MDIYIKGIEMPGHCIECPFMVSHDGDDCILQSNEANENFENWEQMKAGCPLILVPKHGRLIDADALKNIVYEALKDALHDDNATSYGVALCALIAKNIVDEIEAAPAVIPASEEGEG